MKYIFIFLLASLSALGQGAVRRCDTLTELLAIDPRAVATAGKLSYDVVGRRVAGDWVVRTAYWEAGGSAATNSFFRFGAIGAGQWVFADAKEVFIKPEWGANFSDTNATASILEATRLASTNKVVLFTAPMYHVDGMTINAATTAYMNWSSFGSIGVRDNGQFGDFSVIRLRNGSNTNFLTIDGNVSYNIRGLMFNGNKANQANTFPAIHIKGTVSYYSGLFQHSHVLYSKGDGILNESRPQFYFMDSGSAFNDGDGIRLINTVDNIIINATIGKNLGSGVVSSNFTTLRISKLDSFENLGHGIFVESAASTFSSASYFKDCVFNVNGKDGMRIVGNIGLITLDNILFDRANADKVNGFWTNTVPSGTYSFISQHTNSAGHYPKDVSAHNLRLGYFEVGSTLKPAYHMADYTGREFKDWRFDKVNFVNSGSGSPALGTVNFDFEKLKIWDYVFFNTNTVPGTHAAINRLTAGSDTLNTFYPMTVVGNMMIQEKATPANQWVFDPDSTPGWILFKDGVDGNPFFAMSQNGETESWSGGARKIRVNTNGFQAFGNSGAEQLSVIGTGVVVTNRLGVGILPDPSFPLTVKGATILKSVDGVSSHWWTITPDAAGVNGLFGIGDTTDSNPIFYAKNDGDIQIDSTRGLIIPRGNSASESAITSPATSMIRYNTTTQKPRYFNGSAWSDFGVTLEDVQDSLGGGFIVAGSGVSVSYNDGANTLTIANTSPGTSVNVNGVPVANPNLKDSATVTLGVSGSDITFAATPSSTATTVKVDGATVNDPDFIDTSEINIGASGSSISATIKPASINWARVVNVTANRLIGQDNSGAGAPEEIAVVGATFSSGTLTINPQESTNILVNGTKVIETNLKDTPTISWSVAGSDLTGAARLTDGDKGDISVAWPNLTVDNNAITYSKIQSVSANKLLGRRSGSAGNVEEVTVGTGLDLSAGGVLSTTGAGSGITKFATARCRLRSDYSVDSITVSGAMSSTVSFLSGSGVDPAQVSFSFTSAASSSYIVLVEFEDADAFSTPSANRQQYSWKIGNGTKSTAGFTIETAYITSIASPSVYMNVWVIQ